MIMSLGSIRADALHVRISSYRNGLMTKNPEKNLDLHVRQKEAHELSQMKSIQFIVTLYNNLIVK